MNNTENLVETSAEEIVVKTNKIDPKGAAVIGVTIAAAIAIGICVAKKIKSSKEGKTEDTADENPQEMAAEFEA